jgi:hypothetical protein
MRPGLPLVSLTQGGGGQAQLELGLGEDLQKVLVVGEAQVVGYPGAGAPKGGVCPGGHVKGFHLGVFLDWKGRGGRWGQGAGLGQGWGLGGGAWGGRGGRGAGLGAGGWGRGARPESLPPGQNLFLDFPTSGRKASPPETLAKVWMKSWALRVLLWLSWITR